MLYTCLKQVDRSKYNIFSLLRGNTSVVLLKNPFDESLIDLPSPHTFLHGEDWGSRELLTFLDMYDVQQLIFVGFDIWRHAPILQHIRNICDRKKIIWKAIIPYDLPELRDDWLPWFKFLDQVHVYSEFGYNILKPHIDEVFYFRPFPRYFDILKTATPEEKKDLRKKLFPDADDDTLIIGFVGANQLRKNVMCMMKGVSMLVKENPDKKIILYMHMDTIKGVYDVDQLAGDFEFPDAVVRHNGNSRTLFPDEMIAVCKTFDLFLLPSIQEGLSWTVIEMGLLGIPCAISRTTAHFDYMDLPAICNLSIYQRNTASLPLPTLRGVSYIPVQASSPEDINITLNYFVSLSEKEKKNISKSIRAYMLDWCDKCMNISMVLDNVTTKKISDKTELGEIL
jgi:glycosyltransferase involved in cell wall biosynthesis